MRTGAAAPNVPWQAGLARIGQRTVLTAGSPPASPQRRAHELRNGESEPQNRHSIVTRSGCSINFGSGPAVSSMMLNLPCFIVEGILHLIEVPA